MARKKPLSRAFCWFCARKKRDFNILKAQHFCARVNCPSSNSNLEERMEDICSHCHSTIEFGVTRIEIKIGKTHVYCGLCYDVTIKTRWFRRIRKYFLLQSIDAALAPYITKDVPKKC